jgi:hypothetical protein
LRAVLSAQPFVSGASLGSKYPEGTHPAHAEPCFILPHKDRRDGKVSLPVSCALTSLQGAVAIAFESLSASSGTHCVLLFAIVTLWALRPGGAATHRLAWPYPHTRVRIVQQLGEPASLPTRGEQCAPPAGTRTYYVVGGMGVRRVPGYWRASGR